MPGRHPVALGDAGEVQPGNVQAGRVRHPEQSAEPAQRAVRAVAQQHDGERDAQPGRGPQGGDAVVGGPVADHRGHRPVRLGEGDADRAGQAEAEPAGRGEVVGARAAQVHLPPPGRAGRRRLHHVRRVLGLLVTQRREHLLRVEPVPLPRGGGGRGPVLLAGHGGALTENVEQQADHGAGVGDHRLAHRRAGGGRGVLRHLDQPGPLGQVPARQVLVVAEHRRAEHQHQVVPLEGVRDRLDARGEHAAEERVAVGERQPELRRRRPHRAAEPLREADGVVEEPRRVDVAAEHQRRTLGGRDPLHQVAAQLRPGRGAPPHGPVEDGGAVLPRVGGPVVVGHGEIRRPALELRLEDRLGEGAGHVLRAGGLGGPAHQGLHQRGRVHVGQVRLGAHRGPHLLSRHDHHRGPRGHRVGERAHPVAGAGRRVQVHQHRPAGRLGVTVRHADHGALVQAEHVAEAVREVGEEGQLVGPGVAEDGGQAPAGQELVRDMTYGGHERFTFLSCDGRHAKQRLSPETNKCFRSAI